MLNNRPRRPVAERQGDLGRQGREIEFRAATAELGAAITGRVKASISQTAEANR
jgi:hypothetical protein